MAEAHTDVSLYESRIFWVRLFICFLHCSRQYFGTSKKTSYRKAFN